MNTQNTKLTPLPWKIRPTVTTGRFVIVGMQNLVTEDVAQMLPPKPHGTVAQNCELMENHAKMIVHAVNSYESIMGALQTLVKETECYCTDGVAAKGVCGHCSARVAIAKAEVRA